MSAADLCDEKETFGLAYVVANLPPLLRLSAPLACTFLIQIVIQTISLVVVGRIDGELLGSCALGNMMCNLTGYTLSFGLCGALDTLIGQAYGAKSYLLMGLYAQRAVIILTIATIPVALIWTQTDAILRYALAIDPSIAEPAGRWSTISIIGLWPTLMYEILRRFLQAQKLLWPIVVSSVAGMLLHGLGNGLLVGMLHLGFDGAALAFSLTRWLSLIIMVGILLVRRRALRARAGAAQLSYAQHHDEPDAGDTRCSGGDDPEENWPPLSWDIVRGWGPFMRLGVPSAASLLIEWGSFEVATGIAGQMGATALSVHSLMVNTSGLLYMTPLAVATATSTIVNHCLGAGRPWEAQAAVRLGLAVDLAMGAASGVLVAALRWQWGSIFTDDPAVRELAAAALPVMLPYCLVDCAKCLTMAVLRGTGRPGITVFAAAVGCLGVLLPGGWALGLTAGQGLVGLWAAMSGAWLVAAAVCGAAIERSDWARQAALARHRSLPLHRLHPAAAAAGVVTTVAAAAEKGPPPDALEYV